MANMHHPGFEEVTCRQFVELVTDYWEGALPSDRVELLEQHLAICEGCRNYLEQMEATVRALPGTVTAEPVPRWSEESLLAAFRDWHSQR
jgi:predicted anti-sigma-YlaC factor YlaD